MFDVFAPKAPDKILCVYLPISLFVNASISNDYNQTRSHHYPDESRYKLKNVMPSAGSAVNPEPC